ncbi:hypothetical protein [Erwinia sp. 198]|uniref:hypothetical protein n=1 Tax=Erwinia sp. 198 TaxID=2022746 RepID=UPI000F68B09E|nr:hypothetical protein [Erwinia sp. 198]RRZ96867.1 hypothetical protein EGK14_00795 [Erwinia sp. 198]
MDRKTQIRQQILTNGFTLKDYSAFKTNMKIVKKRYHPDLTKDVDLLESITQMAEDSTSLKGMATLFIMMLLFMLRDSDPVALLITLSITLAILAVLLWMHAKGRNLPVSTELRLMKLAFRMRKILKVRAREEKARIKAEKKRQRGK